MEQLQQEAKMCVNDMRDIIEELLEVIGPGKLYTPFFTILRELVDSDSPIQDTEEFRGELRGRIDSFLKDVERNKEERALRIPL